MVRPHHDRDLPLQPIHDALTDLAESLDIPMGDGLDVLGALRIVSGCMLSTTTKRVAHAPMAAAVAEFVKNTARRPNK